MQASDLLTTGGQRDQKNGNMHVPARLVLGRDEKERLDGRRRNRRRLFNIKNIIV